MKGSNRCGSPQELVHLTCAHNKWSLGRADKQRTQAEREPSRSLVITSSLDVFISQMGPYRATLATDNKVGLLGVAAG